MGMDGIEIVMACEERFGISIADSEAEKIRTPRMLTELIAAKLSLTSSTRCQSQRAFYHLRRALTKLGSVNRNDITPRSPIRSFAQTRTEPQFWSDLRGLLQARSWPALALPRPLEFGRNVALLSSFLIMIAASRLLFRHAAIDFSSLLLLNLFTALALVAIVFRIQRPFQTSIPHSFQTLRDLVPFVITSPNIDWTRDEIAAAVREILFEILGPKESIYHEDADLVRDLGLE